MTESSLTATADPAWRKSSFSGAQSECVEIAPIKNAMAIRDSKDPSVGNLAVGVSAWVALTASLRA
ncbi:DUF397 domain-containing protein [Embleya hyalina]|uniref:DUF397 domain-containing protein n=1 Tax=Embleya hyalina TaxID=516124 RepID=UPI000F837EED|nr:DUF397 domain-containing protein [Embleya hyalina]